MAKILVVDDEIGIRELLSDILSDEGYTVETAENAETARRLITTEPFDLILLDIWMPDTDGVSLLKELNVRHLLHCPVLMMSGHATIETAVEATKFGALDCLEKPISMQKLLQSVEHGLQVHERIQSMARYRPEEKKAPEVKLPEEPVMPIPEKLPIFEIKGTGIVIDFNNSLREVRETTERAYLKALMNYENNQMTRVARRAGLERTHLYRKLKALNIPIPRHAANEPLAKLSESAEDGEPAQSSSLG